MRRVPPPEDPADLPATFQPVVADPFDGLPTYDPAAEQNPPPPPGAPSTALATTPPPVDPDAVTVLDLRKKLRSYAVELLTAGPTRVKQLGLEIQRTRVAEKLLTEADEGTSDPDTYKELSMLNRMLAGEQDLDDPTGDEAALAEAEKLLADAGINPDKARRMLRAMESLNTPAEEDDRGRPAGPEGAERGRRRTTH